MSRQIFLYPIAVSASSVMCGWLGGRCLVPDGSLRPRLRVISTPIMGLIPSSFAA